MKRLICSLLIVIVFVGAIAVPASAATYTRTFVRNLGSGYKEYGENSNNTVCFILDAPAVLPSATTWEILPTNAIGRVYVYMVSSDGIDPVTDYTSTPVYGNLLYCCAPFRVASYAVETNHYANRAVGNDITYWDYFYEVPRD